MFARNPEQAEAHRDASSDLCAVLYGVRWTAFRHLHSTLIFSIVSDKCDVYLCAQRFCLVPFENHKACSDEFLLWLMAAMWAADAMLIDGLQID